MTKIVIAAICAASFALTAASAETFTFKSSNGDETVVGGVGADGVRFGGAYWTGSGVSTSQAGKKVKYTYKCVSMSQPPRDSIFMSHSACNVAAEDGNFSAVMGCNILNAETREASCVGGMYGETGAYEGRRGSMTNHGKDGKSSGTGQWLE